jgi:hypothetical protein
MEQNRIRRNSSDGRTRSFEFPIFFYCDCVDPKIPRVLVSSPRSPRLSRARHASRTGSSAASSCSAPITPGDSAFGHAISTKILSCRHEKRTRLNMAAAWHGSGSSVSTLYT